MNRYEIAYENNGRSGATFVVARGIAEAKAKFVAAWEEYGDEFSGSCWVAGIWSIES